MPCVSVPMVEQRHLRVAGEGRVSASPDRYILVAALNVMAETAADAMTTNTQLTAAVTRRVRELGLAETALRTKDLALHDWFDHATQRVTARVASHQIEVTTGSVEQLRQVVAAVTAEARERLQIHGIRGVLADPDAMSAQALGLAVAQAQAKADVLAAAAGVTLGPILSLEEQRALSGQVIHTGGFRTTGLSGPGQATAGWARTAGTVWLVSSTSNHPSARQ